jgi:DNA-binding NarL/FixJ family response regulator
MPVLKTFLVEDSPLIQQSLVATLEELTPVQVVGMAEDEWQAVQWLLQPTQGKHLVIVDIFLKRGSGLGVLKAAQKAATPHTLVVLSNYATKDMRTTCLALGAQRVFDKSTEIEALIQYCGELASRDADTEPQGLGA